MAQSPSKKAIDDSLAAVFGWFEAAPLPDDLASLIEQLEAQSRAPEAEEV